MAERPEKDRMGTTTIYVEFDDADHARLKEAKDEKGKTWKQIIADGCGVEL